MDMCNWAVCYDVDGKNYDDGKTRTQTVALFRFPHAAEDFIRLCLPEETRSRFYVKNIKEV